MGQKPRFPAAFVAVRWSQLVSVLQMHWLAQGYDDSDALQRARQQAERLAQNPAQAATEDKRSAAEP
jgi:hypothetical protein